MTTEHEQNYKNYLEVSWVKIISAGIGLLLVIYTILSSRIDSVEQKKLDKTVFEEHQLTIASMKSDISRIRDILEQHAVHFKPDR